MEEGVSAGSSSLADAFVQRAHRAAEYVLAINHCRDCHDSRTCLYRGCSGTRRVLQHSDVCNDIRCRYPGCDSTKQLLQHIGECKIYRNGMANIDISRSPTFCLMCSLIVKKHREAAPLTPTINHRPFASSSGEVPLKKQRALSESHVLRGESPRKSVDSRDRVPMSRVPISSLGTLDEHSSESEESQEIGLAEEGKESEDVKDPEENVPKVLSEDGFEVPQLPKRYRSQTID